MAQSFNYYYYYYYHQMNSKPIRCQNAVTDSDQGSQKLAVSKQQPARLDIMT